MFQNGDCNRLTISSDYFGHQVLKLMWFHHDFSSQKWFVIFKNKFDLRPVLIQAIAYTAHAETLLNIPIWLPTGFTHRPSGPVQRIEITISTAIFPCIVRSWSTYVLCLALECHFLSLPPSDLRALLRSLADVGRRQPEIRRCPVA